MVDDVELEEAPQRLYGPALTRGLSLNSATPIDQPRRTEDEPYEPNTDPEIESANDMDGAAAADVA